MKPLRVIREYFLSDPDLKKVLGLDKDQIILTVERKTGTLKNRGRDDQAVDLWGCIVTVLDTEEG